MKKIILGAAATAAIAAALAASPAYAAAPTNLSFEEHSDMPLVDGYINVEAGQNYLTNWTVGGAGIDIVNTVLWPAQQGNDSVDLNGQGAGSISQVMDTVKDQVYEVSFWMSGNPDVPQGVKTMNVSAAGTTTEYTVNTTGTTNGTMVWTPQTFTFTAAGSSTELTFASTTSSTVPGFAGPVIDNVVIKAATDVAKSRVWHTWTAGPYANDGVGPSVPNAGWHPTNGDPQSKQHKYENHIPGVPYYVANNGNKGGGSWFLWLEV